MRAHATYDRDSSRLVIRSHAEFGDDPQGLYSGRDAVFHVPPAVEGVHPDLLALATILTLHPFVGTRLSFDFCASEEFKAACQRWLSYDCEFAPTPRGVTIEPRPEGSAPALAFSGGVDSVAALAVMPADTHCIFLDRIVPDGQLAGSAYNKDSALVACEMVTQLGYTVHRVQSTMEYVRKPVGFPVDWSNGVPAVLLADYLDLASIAWGVVAESGYRVGAHGFADFASRPIYRRWDRLLRAVGLRLAAPVAGASEVGTAIIERSSPLAGVAQSCIRGPKGQPCLACKKCFRKVPLDAVLDGRTVPAMTIESLIRFPGFVKYVLARPIKHEDVFRWTAERLEVDGASPAWDAFKARLAVDELDTSWASRWYAPSAALIPSQYRTDAVGTLTRYLSPQNTQEQQSFEQWNIGETTQSEITQRRVENLRVVLEQQNGPTTASAER